MITGKMIRRRTGLEQKPKEDQPTASRVPAHPSSNLLFSHHFTPNHFTFSLSSCLAIATCLSSPALAADRAEFAEKPRLSRNGDLVAIAFASKGFCDATVAIEDSAGRIVRFLASGALGPNAPAPFQKNALRQSLVWDSKDEGGRYVDDKDALSVRVSLGLKARFERTLYWSPKRRTRDPCYLDNNLVFAAAPEGVYVYDGGNGDHLRLFDHQGNYVRTVYPPPAGRLKDFDGLLWREFPQDGARLPLKWGLNQSTFLTAGNLEAGGSTWPVGGGSEVRTMAARDGQLLLACQRINRLASDGGTGGRPLAGPNVFIPVHVPGVHEWRGGIVNVPPTDAAFSPDGKWLYLAGYVWTRSWRNGGLCGVARMPADGSGKLECFVGTLEPYKKGTENGQFRIAAGLDVDPQGRVYVADHGNSRVQVFDPAGKHLKNIPVEHPALVRVSPKNGEVYVFGWDVPHGDLYQTAWDGREGANRKFPKFSRFGPVENPELKATYPLDVANWGINDAPACRATVDFWAEPPTIWLCDTGRASYGWEQHRLERSCARLLVEKDGKLAVVRDFGADAKQDVTWLRGARHMKQRLYFNPKSRKLYVGELHGPWPFHVTSIHDLPVIDPDTGKVQVTKLPFDAEDMAFDADGLAYLRTADAVVRYDSATWREVPFDYGEESRAVTALGLPHATARVASAATFAGVLGIASGQMGGIGVSPKGHVVVSVCNPEATADRKNEKSAFRDLVRPYVPQVYPGRCRPWEVHVFDRHGKLLHQDAVPGIGRMVGINMDRDDNIYVMLAGIGSVAGKPYFNPLSCSMLKLRPGTKFISTNAVLPLPDGARPKRPPDLTDVDTCGTVWVDRPCWIRGGVAFDGKRVKCHCGSQSRPALDFFARSFLPEVDHYSVLVLDSAGNELLRIGRYGNVDDGTPLVPEGGPSLVGGASAPRLRSIGGDEVALMHPQMLAVDSDRRLFISDLGNARIVSVKLGYHATERVPLKEAPHKADDARPHTGPPPRP
ncbi:MAG: hypothetical protein FJ291_05640 [Planctomycetes bacterium]|nr:hypothetical protein [Planctomycetota bacterium]